MEEYIRLASKLDVDRGEALTLLADHDGDVHSASRALARKFAAESCRDQSALSTRELKEVVASSMAWQVLKQEVARLTQQLQVEQTQRVAAERRAEVAGLEMARLQGEALTAAVAEQARATRRPTRNGRS